ncbi:MAG TPA: hypothetical protein VL403_01790 [Candidatus Kryptonia bacterium]|nr:hypothetical protein [Candidatus Kryptonia bacterium]
MGEEPREGQATTEEESGNLESEFSIARSRALIPLLVMFGLTVLAILVVIVRAKPMEPPVGTVANKAYRPSDFPMVFGREEGLAAMAAGSAPGTEAVLFPVPDPPFSEGIFPCSTCHAGIPPNPERRPLEGMHNDIVLHHDEEHRWCLDCHDTNDRDHLHLAGGTLVPFTESYRLCGQCHGTQYRDWRSGVHGKRTGYWDGPKRYLLCVNCHNPHSPRFKPLHPLPPPVRPQFLRPEDVVASTAPGAARPDGDHEEKNDAGLH